MKKFFVLFTILFGAIISGNAQEIFNNYLDNARKTANDTTCNIIERKIAQFKYTDLQYIKRKAFESERVVTREFLDNQAYFMSQFISTFFQEAVLNSNLTKMQKKERIMLFVDASGSNPLFYDTDRELVDAYVNTKGQLTPFSLDTDWPKAFAAVASKLKK